MKDLEKFGKQVRSYREEAGVKRAYLARVAGISPTYLWIIESAQRRTNGEFSQPSKMVARALCLALQLNLNDAQALMSLAGYEKDLDITKTRSENTFSIELSEIEGVFIVDAVASAIHTLNDVLDSPAANLLGADRINEKRLLAKMLNDRLTRDILEYQREI